MCLLYLSPQLTYNIKEDLDVLVSVSLALLHLFPHLPQCPVYYDIHIGHLPKHCCPQGPYVLHHLIENVGQHLIYSNPVHPLIQKLLLIGSNLQHIKMATSQLSTLMKEVSSVQLSLAVHVVNVTQLIMGLLGQRIVLICPLEILNDGSTINMWNNGKTLIICPYLLKQTVETTPDLGSIALLPDDANGPGVYNQC